MKTKATILSLLLIILVSTHSFAGGWLIYHDGPYTGKVVDAATGQPIEGAAVAAIWYLERFGGSGGPIAKFFEAKETLTNNNGEFLIPAITGFHWWPFSALGRPILKIYKPGYGSYEKFNYEINQNTIKLAKAETQNERMKALLGIDVCGYVADDLCIPRKKVLNIVNTIELEARKLGLLN